MSDQALREQLVALLHWDDAHAGFDRVVDGVPLDRWSAAAPGLPYTLWQLLEHVRLAQFDILDFCRNPGYVQRRWPEDYWPPASASPTAEEVRASLAAVRQDRASLAGMALDREVDLFAGIPHGTGQTYLRELLLVADHTSYHLGQMVAVRRALRLWD
ncbi:MAG TPA: DinB family protein [Gemmatimonadales bacterium]|nr:DinB family protein [Gemmatimonadales bacterium]